MKIFGFQITRQNPQEERPEAKSFVPQIEDDGAVTVAAGGSYGTYVDLEGSVRTEAELITKYREMSQQAEMDAAIDDVVNEAIVDNPENPVVEVDFDDEKKTIPDKVKEMVQEEFKGVLKLLDFQDHSYEIFKRWYVDGRLYYHVVIDLKAPQDGIIELRQIDPRKIRKIKELKKDKSPNSPAATVDVVSEYYLYNEKGFAPTTRPDPTSINATGIRIAKDAIVHVPSGLMDKNNTTVLSHLHKAIKPLNILRTLEDAVVIYRYSRAPERRIFYIDVGNLPKSKAEQYLRDMMVRHKNRLVYDAATGEVRDDRKFMTMLEDYWLPRREGNRGTEITTLPAGQNLGEMEDVLYFQKKLYKALNIPSSRLEQETVFSFGKSAEITRDEIKFFKFIQRLRLKFSELFLQSIEKQILLKGWMTPDEWNQVKPLVRFKYARDNHYAELMDIEVMNMRLGVLQLIDPFVGKYYSSNWVKKNVLRQTEEEIEEIGQEMEVDYQNMLEMQQQANDQQGGQQGQQGGGQGQQPAQQQPQLPQMAAEDIEGKLFDAKQIELVESLQKFIDSQLDEEH